MIGIIENKKDYWIKEKNIIKNKILNLNPENKIEKLSFQFALQFIEKTIEDLEEIAETTRNINTYQKACISLINNQHK